MSEISTETDTPNAVIILGLLTFACMCKELRVDYYALWILETIAMGLFPLCLTLILASWAWLGCYFYYTIRVRMCFRGIEYNTILWWVVNIPLFIVVDLNIIPVLEREISHANERIPELYREYQREVRAHWIKLGTF